MNTTVTTPSPFYKIKSKNMLVENPYCAIQIMHSGIWNCCAVLRLAISKNVRV